jgi:mannose/fructose/N-acetylgalactosamine-specific phosphotransferase system component IIC
MNIKKIKKIVISTVVLISIAAVGTWLSILYIENKEIKQTKREREEKLQIINTSIQFVG